MKISVKIISIALYFSSFMLLGMNEKNNRAPLKQKHSEQVANEIVKFINDNQAATLTSSYSLNKKNTTLLKDKELTWCIKKKSNMLFSVLLCRKYIKTNPRNPKHKGMEATQKIRKFQFLLLKSDNGSNIKFLNATSYTTNYSSMDKKIKEKKIVLDKLVRAILTALKNKINTASNINKAGQFTIENVITLHRSLQDAFELYKKDNKLAGNVKKHLETLATLNPSFTGKTTIFGANKSLIFKNTKLIEEEILVPSGFVIRFQQPSQMEDEDFLRLLLESTKLSHNIVDNKNVVVYANTIRMLCMRKPDLLKKFITSKFDVINFSLAFCHPVIDGVFIELAKPVSSPKKNNVPVYKPRTPEEKKKVDEAAQKCSQTLIQKINEHSFMEFLNNRDKSEKSVKRYSLGQAFEEYKNFYWHACYVGKKNESSIKVFIVVDKANYAMKKNNIDSGKLYEKSKKEQLAYCELTIKNMIKKQRIDIYIDYLQTNDQVRQNGFGAALLYTILGLAKSLKSRVKVHLMAVPLEDSSMLNILVKYYKGFGFVPKAKDHDFQRLYIDENGVMIKSFDIKEYLKPQYMQRMTAYNYCATDIAETIRCFIDENEKKVSAQKNDQLINITEPIFSYKKKVSWSIKKQKKNIYSLLFYRKYTDKYNKEQCEKLRRITFSLEKNKALNTATLNYLSSKNYHLAKGDHFKVARLLFICSAIFKSLLDKMGTEYKILNNVPKSYANALGYSQEDDLYKYSEEYMQNELFGKMQTIKEEFEKSTVNLNDRYNVNNIGFEIEPIAVADLKKMSNDILPVTENLPTGVNNAGLSSAQSSYRSTISNALWTAGGYFLSELITNAMHFYNKPDTALMKNIGLKNILPLFGIIAFHWKLAPDANKSERYYPKTAWALGFAGGIGWKLINGFKNETHKSYLPTQKS